jgi:hypothetical protein
MVNDEQKLLVPHHQELLAQLIKELQKEINTISPLTPRTQAFDTFNLIDERMLNIQGELKRLKEQFD